MQMPDKDKFLKGLAVIDDMAYFGISVWSTRAARGDASHDSELAAFCLRGMTLLWRRTVRDADAETSGVCKLAYTAGIMSVHILASCSSLAGWLGHWLVHLHSQLPTHGLLNVVAAPHLAVASTYRALEPQLPRPKRDPVRASSLWQPAAVRA